MLTIVLGYKTPSRHETPAVVYIGQKGSEAAAAIARCELPRIERLDGVEARTVRAYRPPQPEAKKP